MKSIFSRTLLSLMIVFSLVFLTIPASAADPPGRADSIKLIKNVPTGEMPGLQISSYLETFKPIPISPTKAIYIIYNNHGVSNRERPAPDIVMLC